MILLASVNEPQSETSNVHQLCKLTNCIDLKRLGVISQAVDCHTGVHSNIIIYKTYHIELADAIDPLRNTYSRLVSTKRLILPEPLNNWGWIATGSTGNSQIFTFHHISVSKRK